MQQDTNNHIHSAGEDPSAESRKKDHIQMAFQSQIPRTELDERFYYEPLLCAHPSGNSWPAFSFLGKTMRTPLWVSSMTGGTALARRINHNLARACGEFGMGMGLGSCRQLLYSDEFLSDFAVRPLISKEYPLYTNLGIAQVEQLIQKKELERIDQLVHKLEADGLIIHINPLQEWLQPEGDRFQRPPLETIQALLENASYPVIVKEVGQGMGIQSLRALLKLPLAAIDFAAAGGTNFAKLELLRSSPQKAEIFGKLAHIGHTYTDMVDLVNALAVEMGSEIQCKQIIVSGGIKHFLDGYYAIRKLQLPAIYGQASAFLQYAREDYAMLHAYVAAQIEGLEIANAFLHIRN